MIAGTRQPATRPAQKIEMKMFHSRCACYPNAVVSTFERVPMISFRATASKLPTVRGSPCSTRQNQKPISTSFSDATAGSPARGIFAISKAVTPYGLRTTPPGYFLKKCVEAYSLKCQRLDVNKGHLKFKEVAFTTTSEERWRWGKRQNGTLGVGIIRRVFAVTDGTIMPNICFGPQPTRTGKRYVGI